MAGRDPLAQLHAERKAAGACRHCGGPVPCWSYFGDDRPGVRHTHRSHAAAQGAASLAAQQAAAAQSSHDSAKREGKGTT